MRELRDGYIALCRSYDEILFVKKRTDGTLDFRIASWYNDDAINDCGRDYVDTKDLWLDEVNNNWYEYSLESFESNMYIRDYYDFYDNHDEPPSEVTDMLEDECWYVLDDWAFDWNSVSEWKARLFVNNNDEIYNETALEFVKNRIGREKINFLECEPVR